MTIWDSLIGRKPGTGSSASSSSSSSSTLTSSAPSSSSEDLRDRAPGTNFAPSPVQAQDVSTLLSSTGPLADPSQLHPLANLGSGDLDYLTLDEAVYSDLPGDHSALPSRGWSDDLCYGTGVTYIAALGLGGAWGLAEGLNRSPPSAPPKLKLNSVLNSVTRRGPFLGNSAGVVALVYNVINSTIGHYRGRHDALSSIAAGGLSGMLFKSTRGLRPMMISGGIVAGAAGTWTLLKKSLF